MRSGRRRVAIMDLMATPRAVDIAITSRCNLHCAYCSHFSSAGDVEADLPASEWARFFDELNHLGVMNLTIQGGEPFLREDLPEILEEIVRNRMRFAILSNGTLISDEMAAFLSATGRCDGVQVSLDGAQANHHDALRGKGTFDKALAGLERLRSHGIPVWARVTLHRMNVNDLEGIAALLLDELSLPYFSTNEASFFGLCRENMNHVGLTMAERTLAMATLMRLNEQYNGRIGASAGPLADAEVWLGMEQAHSDKRASVRGEGRLTGCGCVFHKIDVRADGVVVPCLLLSHIPLGRINRDDFGRLWRESPQLNRIRERGRISLRYFEFCHDCEYIDYCTGNCPALAYTQTGMVDHPSPNGCLRRFLDSGGKLPKMGSVLSDLSL